MIDYDALKNKLNTSSQITKPRELYLSMPNKDPKFSYPRDVQAAVWDQWFERKGENDLVLKLNTGGGKTLVGLIILLSSIKEGVFPGVYVAPNDVLVNQVKEEAKLLDIQTTSDPRDPQFLSGAAILVINTHTLINGRSKFGVDGDNKEPIKIGAIIFDDAHACLETIEQQFSIDVPRDKAFDVYEKLLNLFHPYLDEQNPSKTMEIRDYAPGRKMLLPFWAWHKHQAEVLKIFNENRSASWLEWNWPLVKESLKLCHCVVSSERIEITPHCVPIEKIPSVPAASRRIFMTATLADDAVLSTHFGVTEQTILEPIAPSNAGDVGDRIILSPQLIAPDSTDDQIRDLAVRLSKKVNVVAIVPSFSKSTAWDGYADKILNGDEIDTEVKKLRDGHVGLVVLVNRYDGIDLPKDACRVLILDGIPDVRRSIDVLKQSYLMGSSKASAQIAQRIEQGAGRGIRSVEDYCAVLLMGKNLCAQVHNQGVREKFSPATKAQMDLSDMVAESAHSLTDIEMILENEFLDRASDWPQLSRHAVSQLTQSPCTPDPLYVGLRIAFDFAQIGNVNESIKFLRSIDSDMASDKERGLLKQYLAEYLNWVDPSESQKTLLFAKQLNRGLLLPIEGISFARPPSAADDQASACMDHIKENYSDPNKFLLGINSLLSELRVGEEYVPRFEEAFKQLAYILGFVGSRPEVEANRGPDVLWSMKQQKYIVIECKSGATTDTITKDYCGQLNTSVAWFHDEFDSSCSCVALMVHPSFHIENAATLTEGSRIMTFEDLEKLKGEVSSLCKAIAANFSEFTKAEVRDLLVEKSLYSTHFINKYSRKPKT